MTSMAGKTVVITGASRGLGEAMAVGFAGLGADLVLASRDEQDLAAVAAQCADAGAGSVDVVPTDVGDAESVQALVDVTIEAHGAIDVFIANAGTSYPSLTDKRFTTLDTYDVDIAETIFRVNTLGMWHCMRSALPRMERGSNFIAIGSETGRIARAGSGLYAVSKATVDVLVTIAAGEMAEAGVRVNCLTPGGMVNTNLFGPDKMPEFLKNLPMGYSEPDVIVPAALWLASDEAAEVTGIEISGQRFNNDGPGAARPLGSASGTMPTSGKV